MTFWWKAAAALPAAVFVGTGSAWLVAPDFAAARMRMELLTGDGLSTQIADLAAFFLTLGGCILLGLGTGRPVWLWPPILMLGLAIVGRIVAWGLHGAGLTLDLILVEVAVAALLVAVARHMGAAR